MITRLFIISLITVFFGNLSGQNRTVSGFITDAETGETIYGATVFVENSTTGTHSNAYGFYSLTLKTEELQTVIVSYIGYKSQKIEIEPKSDLTKNIALVPDNLLEEVEIHGNRIENRTETGTVEIPMSQMKMLPVIGAEADIMKALQLMPGVQSGSEGTSGLYVRGGSPDQNLILLDDVPLYYVNHLGGFVSVFNSDALSSVQLIKGGFPARYGGRLSSVVDVRMKDGNMKTFEGVYSMGIIASKLHIEGPIKKDTASFILSLRGMPWEILYRPLTVLATEGLSVGYNFYDANAKLNYKINPKNRLYFSFYKGDDNVVIKLKDNSMYASEEGHSIIRWGNLLSAFRWNHTFSNKFFLNTTISYTKYRYTTDYEYKNKADKDYFLHSFTTLINDLSANTDFQYIVSDAYRIRFGTSSILHKFQPGLTQFKVEESGETIVDTAFAYQAFTVPEHRTFIENNFKFSSFFDANIGVNLSHYFLKTKTFSSVQPRIILNFKLSEKISLKTSYSEMQQNVQLLTSNMATVPMDLWIPATRKLPPSYSRQIAGGIYTSLWDGKFEISAETYYKTMQNLIAYKEGTPARKIAEHWEDKIETGGVGTSYGAEFLLQKKQGKTTGWISYTYARTDHRFANINNGKAYPFKYDRRHDISLVVMHKFSEKVDLSASWVFGTGYPYTLALARYETVNEGASFFGNWTGRDQAWFNEPAFLYSDRNAYRMRAYHRLDLGANFRKQKTKGIRTWTISVYNTYNRQNPYFYYSKQDAVGNWKLYQQSLFPIIPSISYSFEF